MEVSVFVDTLTSTAPMERIMNAYFLMVALDRRTRKSAPVNPLLTQTEDECAWIEQGRLRQQQRIADAAKSLTSVPPHVDEIAHIHCFLTQVPEVGS